MKRFNSFYELYKKNKEIFDVIIILILSVLLIWQIIFTLIFPLRINVIILLILIILILFFFFKVYRSD